MNRQQLNEIISGVIRRSGACGDISDIAGSVVGSVPDGELRDALEVTMREYVRAYIGLQRVAALSPRSPASDNVGKFSGVGPSRRSVAVNAYRQTLETTMVSVADDKIKALGQLTVEDVEHQIAKLDKQLAAIGHRHDWYTAIAKAMRHYGAKRVVDLPQKILPALIQGVAA